MSGSGQFASDGLAAQWAPAWRTSAFQARQSSAAPAPTPAAALSVPAPANPVARALAPILAPMQTTMSSSATLLIRQTILTSPPPPPPPPTAAKAISPQPQAFPLLLPSLPPKAKSAFDEEESDSPRSRDSKMFVPAPMICVPAISRLPSPIRLAAGAGAGAATAPELAPAPLPLPRPTLILAELYTQIASITARANVAEERLQEALRVRDGLVARATLAEAESTATRKDLGKALRTIASLEATVLLYGYADARARSAEGLLMAAMTDKLSTEKNAAAVAATWITASGSLPHPGAAANGSPRALLLQAGGGVSDSSRATTVVAAALAFQTPKALVPLSLSNPQKGTIQTMVPMPTLMPTLKPTLVPLPPPLSMSTPLPAPVNNAPLITPPPTTTTAASATNAVAAGVTRTSVAAAAAGVITTAAAAAAAAIASATTVPTPATPLSQLRAIILELYLGDPEQWTYGYSRWDIFLCLRNNYISGDASFKFLKQFQDRAFSKKNDYAPRIAEIDILVGKYGDKILKTLVTTFGADGGGGGGWE